MGLYRSWNLGVHIDVVDGAPENNYVLWSLGIHIDVVGGVLKQMDLESHLELGRLYRRGW